MTRKAEVLHRYAHPHEACDGCEEPMTEAWQVSPMPGRGHAPTVFCRACLDGLVEAITMIRVCEESWLQMQQREATP